LKLRSFISIELPDKIKSCLEEIQGELKKCRADIRWVKTGNIHLTLKFLGDVNEADVDKILSVISAACSKCEAFDLEVAGVGVFPHVRSPRVLWVGISDSEILSRLQGEIDRGLASLGFEREKRKFSPHLTLGRFKSSRGREPLLKNIPSLRGGAIGTISVKSVKLMRSELHPDGARYSTISEVALGSHDVP
jgi:2'-5' RNA ligase